MTGPVNEPPAGGQPAGPLLGAVTLPCGAEVDLLLEQVADGHAADRDATSRDACTARPRSAEFAALWAPVTELAASSVPAPPGLAAAVMSQIRVLVRDVWYTLQTTNLGAIRIAARIVAALARDSARAVPGVRVALGRSTHGKVAALAEQATFGHHHPHAAVGVLGRTAVVDLAVAVTLRRACPPGSPRHPAARHRHATRHARAQDRNRQRHRGRRPHRRRKRLSRPPRCDSLGTTPLAHPRSLPDEPQSLHRRGCQPDPPRPAPHEHHPGQRPLAR